MVAATRTTVPPDDEFRTPVESWPTRYPAPGSYLRVVANPFLGVAALLLGASALTRWLDRSPALSDQFWIFLLIAVFLLKGHPRLFQFHCLDCGATGPLRDWKAHACFPSALNRFLGRRGWCSWLTPGVQVVLWIMALIHAVMTLSVLL